jgi:hypothetical protein
MHVNRLPLRDSSRLRPGGFEHQHPVLGRLLKMVEGEPPEQQMADLVRDGDADVSFCALRGTMSHGCGSAALSNPALSATGTNAAGMDPPPADLLDPVGGNHMRRSASAFAFLQALMVSLFDSLRRLWSPIDSMSSCATAVRAASSTPAVVVSLGLLLSLALIIVGINLPTAAG